MASFASAHFVERLVHLGDDVEAIENVHRIAATLADDAQIRLPQQGRADQGEELFKALDSQSTLAWSRAGAALADIFSVTARDEGRPISDLTHRLNYGEFAADAKRVLADLAPVERTVRSQDGRWYLMRMRPYRTLDDKNEGIVVTFVDVTEPPGGRDEMGSRAKAAARRTLT